MEADRSKIRLNEPASCWAEGFPLGNGRIGAMTWGTPGAEIVSFNHDLLWRACYDGPSVSLGDKAQTVRELCLAERYEEADAVLRSVIQDQRGIYINPFVPFCDLYLNLLLPEGETTDYERALDMERGTVKVSFRRNGTAYGYECFCSYRYNAFYMKVFSSRPVSLSGEISLFRMPDAECCLEGSAGYRTLRLDGRFDEQKSFSAAVKLENRGGRTLIGRRAVSLAPEKSRFDARFGLGYSFDRDTGIEPDRGPSLIFDSCDEVILTVSLATDGEDDAPASYALKTLDAAPDYDTALADHTGDFSALFGRTRLFLAEGEEAETLERQYNMSRYLAISAGRPQPPERALKAPMNLQGIWCRDTRPAWESDYHTDLNIEMCYWPMAEAGLPEWVEPLLAWAERLLPQAEKRAEELYGQPGAAWNGCADPWILGGTDNVGYGFLGAGAWIIQTLRFLLEYLPSEELSKRLYALSLPTARFLDAMLVETEDGHRTFPFGSSPEMAIRTKNGIQWLASASTCDLLLTKELFESLAALSPGSAEQYDGSRIISVTKGGKVGEWIGDHEENEPGHRHRSPFICFCPGNSVTKGNNPALVRALSDLLDRRLAAGGGMSTSFSYVWDTQILARFGRGEEALQQLRELFRIHLLPNGLLTTNDWASRGGIGWFPAVKVIQLDASVGLISSITELFYQDQEGFAELLPACPKAFRSGRITGVYGRNGFITDFSWADGKIVSVTVCSLLGRVYKLRIPTGTGMLVNGEKTFNGDVLSIPTQEGGLYVIIPIYQ